MQQLGYSASDSPLTRRFAPPSPSEGEGGFAARPRFLSTHSYRKRVPRRLWSSFLTLPTRPDLREYSARLHPVPSPMGRGIRVRAYVLSIVCNPSPQPSPNGRGSVLRSEIPLAHHQWAEISASRGHPQCPPC